MPVVPNGARVICQVLPRRATIYCTPHICEVEMKPALDQSLQLRPDVELHWTRKIDHNARQRTRLNETQEGLVGEKAAPTVLRLRGEGGRYDGRRLRADATFIRAPVTAKLRRTYGGRELREILGVSSESQYPDGTPLRGIAPESSKSEIDIDFAGGDHAGAIF
ncbi:hypothetical protein B0H17DRAFT_1173575 [Mycena rosella]|uniref:Uncharacterized protein n=1 Tax=Mycena rosella TaxID=1033263 RepID=A0AAD7H2W1_MYCRO|nr:hypothetical protein B0H17DRAFT_1173575 [Mycena rosella]